MRLNSWIEMTWTCRLPLLQSFHKAQNPNRKLYINSNSMYLVPSWLFEGKLLEGKRKGRGLEDVAENRNGMHDGNKAKKEKKKKKNLTFGLDNPHQKFYQVT